MILFPVPAPAGTPGWINILFIAGAAAVLGVLVWQAVRTFRDRRDD